MNAVGFCLGQNFRERSAELLGKICVLDTQHHLVGISVMMETSVAQDCSNNVGEFWTGFQRKPVEVPPWQMDSAYPLAYGSLGQFGLVFLQHDLLHRIICDSPSIQFED